MEANQANALGNLVVENQQAGQNQEDQELEATRDKQGTVGLKVAKAGQAVENHRPEHRTLVLEQATAEDQAVVPTDKFVIKVLAREAGNQAVDLHPEVKIPDPDQATAGNQAVDNLHPEIKIQDPDQALVGNQAVDNLHPEIKILDPDQALVGNQAVDNLHPEIKIPDPAGNQVVVQMDKLRKLVLEVAKAQDQAGDNQAKVQDQAVDNQAKAQDQAVDNQATAQDQAVDNQATAQDQVVDNQAKAQDQAVDNQAKAQDQAVDNQAKVQDQAVDSQAKAQDHQAVVQVDKEVLREEKNNNVHSITKLSAFSETNTEKSNSPKSERKK
jgi:hypothetical protein